MKKLVLLVAGLVVLGLAPAQAADKKGTVLLPTAATARLQRCDDVHGQANGTFGYKLPVAAGKNFTLKADQFGGRFDPPDGDTDVPPPLNDFDIAFYKSYTPCAENAAAVAAATDHTNIYGDEIGKVPPDAAVAIITLATGIPGSAFTYDEA